MVPHRSITERQLQCLAWAQEGKSATDIGVILGLSGRTVEKHLTKLCGHLGVKTRVQAVVRARARSNRLGTGVSLRLEAG
ncbi:helix-turn-helix domain-containing protein [Phenylobacterium sp. VNQ135]|uniref:helix-turn-helix domain-containing protein n=1 Tax=Phenylobacterium sp. VNQ135 TaxID=3400922 RepID=UPI003BFE2106